uniref:Na+/H+ antiporter subunit E n=1 Tax=Luteococcus sp. TaxID=1969402 RepID=UPI0037352DAA
PRPVGRGSLVDVQLHLHDDLRRTIIAEFTSLVPGTVVIDVHPETSILTIHVLDITDEDQLRRERENIWALERRVAAALEVRPTPLDDQHDQAGQDNQEGDR